MKEVAPDLIPYLIRDIPELAQAWIDIVITPSQNEGVIFDAKEERDSRHYKNLHGEGEHVDGLTGFYHNKYYYHGVYQPNKHNK